MGGHVSVFRLLQTFATDRSLGTIWRAVPANLVTAVPLHVVERIGGPSVRAVIDLPRVDVDTFASTEDDAEELAETIRAAVDTALPGYMYAGSVVSRTRTLTGPRLIPWGSSAVFRAQATYELTVHRYAGVT